jgi:transcriptional regulator with XRE-family HTH domain
MIADPILALRKQISKASLRKVAIEIGISAPYLSDVMRGNRLPGPKVLKYLGLRRVITKQVQYLKDRS